MKNKNLSQNRGTIVLFILICLMLYAFVPRPRAQGCGGCYGSYVWAGNNNGVGTIWHDPPEPGDGTPTPTITTNCGSGIWVDGGASIADATCGTFVSTTSVNIDVGGTQAQVDHSTNAYGGDQYWVHDPKNTGVIKISVTLTGSVTNCSTGCVPLTLHPQGSVNVTGCSSCSSTCTRPSAGSANCDNNSIDFKLNLGATSPLSSYSVMSLKVDAAAANLAQPSLLQVPYVDQMVEVITNSGGTIEQVNTPQMLVNVSVLGSYEYQLQCFYETNVTPKVGGLYGTNAPAFDIWDIKNPDGASAYNRLWITESNGGTPRQFQYTYTASSNRWDLLKPDGQTLSTWRIPNTSNVNITNYWRQVSVGSQIFSLDVQPFQFVPGAGQNLVLSDTNGFNGVTQITTYAYYTNGPASNRVQEVIYPDGNWSYYTYDSMARKIREYSTFGNSPAPTPGTEPDPTVVHCKVTQYDYSLTNAVDGIDDPGDPYNPWTERKTTVYLPVQSGGAWQIQEVSRAYRLTTTSTQGLEAEERIQCPNPGAYYNDPANVVTITYYNIGSGFSSGQISQITHPDGSITTFSYPDMFTTVEADPDGSTTTSIVDQFGNPQSRQKIDNGSGVVLSQTIYVYTNSFGALYDPLMRTHDEIDLGGHTTHYTYDCCTLESVLDPDGVQTDYTYDVLKRQIASTVYYGGSFGITTSNTLDPLGNALVITRIGTNNLSIVLQQFAYDAVGRLVAQTNALGGVTVITNVLVGEQLCVTNINPAGGTQVELRYIDGTIQSTTGTATYGVQYTNDVEQDPNTSYWRQVVTETKLDATGNPTSEWTKTFTDGAGHDYLTLYAAASGPYPSQESFYNSNGQLWKSVDPDGDVTFTVYYDNYYSNPGDINQGKLAYTIQALDPTTQGITNYGSLVSSIGTIESDVDRVTFQHESVVPAHGGIPDLVETSFYQWTNNETDGTGTLILSNAISSTGLTNWFARYASPNIPVTSQNQTAYSNLGNGHSLTVIAPTGSYSTYVYNYGLLSTFTQYDSNGTQTAQTAYTYDAHGRQYQVSDARNGSTTYSYNNADLVSSVTTPNPGAGGSAETTTAYYSPMLEVTNINNSDNTSVTNLYYLTGDLEQTSGSRTYPVGYGYDYAGRIKTMTNWQGFPTSGTEVTTWKYDGYRGFLTNQAYADTNGPSYTYTAAGRLASRTWARGVTTHYYYDGTGGITNMAYSDTTPAVTNTYDRLGRLSSVACNGMTNTVSYDLVNDVISNGYSGGVLNGLATTIGFDQFLRRTNIAFVKASGILSSAAYGYNAASQLQMVSDGSGNSASYSYLANSPLVSQITFKSNGFTAMVTTKSYDYLNRLISISNAPSSGPGLNFDYAYNAANQRTSVSNIDGSYWIYQYDNLGQLTSGKKYWRDGTPVAGQQFTYAFDTIGNRTQTQSGGDQTGANLRIANYTNNALNQFTGRDVPGYLDIKGVSIATNSVTVNGNQAYRKWEYFRNELAVNNGSTALWSNITVVATGQTGVTGSVYIAQQPEIFLYDSDGNLTNDGRWSYTWDAENRLVKMTAHTNAGPQYQLMFTYDANGRRIQKIAATNGVVIYTNNFVYDGWKLTAIFNPQSTAIQSFIWGIDLSESLSGAGGVGGLLQVSSSGSATTNSFVEFDGNGNVSGLVNTADGSTSGQCEYGPFGEVVRVTGSAAKSEPVRFSSKYQDSESDLAYYGYRTYNSSTGRWLSRDPIGSDGSLDVYDFVANSPVNSADALGLCDFCHCKKLNTPPNNYKPKSLTLVPLPGTFATAYGLGFANPIDWDLEPGSKPELCKFHVKEAPNKKAGKGPNGAISIGGTDQDYSGNPVTDYPNARINGDGPYVVNMNIKATYTCTGTDTCKGDDKPKNANIHIKFTYTFNATTDLTTGVPTISNLQIQ